MKTYKQFISGQLDEALITFGGKAYPKFGNVVIIAGGAATGKSFVKNKLLGIEGYSYDPDDMKKLVVQIPLLIKNIKDRTGVDVTRYDTKLYKDVMKDPAKVTELHVLIRDWLALDVKRKSSVFASAMTASVERKPNLIFDLTMEKITQLERHTTPIQNFGYDKKNFHIVWVVKSLEASLELNKSRDRVVDDSVVFKTHAGASLSMKTIISMGENISRYMDGDIVFVIGDSKVTDSVNGGSYVSKSNYIYVKRQGKSIDKDALTKDVINQINNMVPKSTKW